MTARHPPPHRWAGGDRGIDQTGSRRRWFRVHGRLRSTRTYVGRQFRLTTSLRTPADSASVLVAGAAAAPATRRHPRRPSWAPVPVRSTFRPSAAHKKLVLAHRFTPVSGVASEEPRAKFIVGLLPLEWTKLSCTPIGITSPLEGETSEKDPRRRHGSIRCIHPNYLDRVWKHSACRHTSVGHCYCARASHSDRDA